MITFSSRPISPEEISRRKEGIASIGLRKAWLGDVALHVLIPIFAAMPFVGLSWTIGCVLPRYAVPITLAGGLFGLLCAVRAWRRGAREEGSYSILKRGMAQYQGDLDQNVMQVVQIKSVLEAWSVDDLEDFGPGYILRTTEDEYVYVCGQVIEQSVSRDLEETETRQEVDEYEPLPFPTEHIELEVWPISREIESVKASGPVIETQGFVSSSDLNVQLIDGFHLFENSAGVRSVLQSTETT